MNLKQLTLLHYGEHNPILTKNLTYLILYYLYNKNIGMTKIQKMISSILLKYLKDSKEIVFQYRHGNVPLDVDKTLAELADEGIIDIVEKDKKRLIVLTDKGLNHVKENVLPNVKEHPSFNDVIDEIRSLYLKSTDELVKIAYERASHLNYFVRPVRDHKIAYIFDWNEYGDGLKIRPYHISMLFAFAHYENYFKNVKKMLPSDIIDIDEIPKAVYSNELLKTCGKKKAVLLSEVFQKKEPPFLTEDKEEGKNYIANLWMIVEAINIFHVISRIPPNIDELSTICLKYVFFGKNTKFKKIPKEELRLLKEKLIRNDLKKLRDFCIIKQVKSDTRKEVRYRLAAKNYIDYYLGREFKVLDEEILQQFYNDRIKPLVIPDIPK